MISPDEALDLVIQTAAPLSPQPCSLAAACGLVLAEDVAADQDYPPFRRAMMDGFAVRLADGGKTVPVLGKFRLARVGEACSPTAAAWPSSPGRPARWEPMPSCPRSTPNDRGRRSLCRRSSCRNQNIASRGSDCRRGERVLAAGMRVTPLAVAALASFGKRSVRVIPRPRLGIIATGGELAAEPSHARARPIRDSNGPMLAAMAWNWESMPRGVFRPAKFAGTPPSCRAEADMDLVVLAGGVSVGTYDLVPQALADIGAETVFHGVKQKPGKPVLFARTRRQVFFGLPGNPLACHLGFHRYVSAAIRKMSGGDGRQHCFLGELAGPVESKRGRTHFVPGRGEPAPAAGALAHRGVARRKFRRHICTCAANCYIEVPPLGRTLPAGETCTFTWMANQA